MKRRAPMRYRPPRSGLRRLVTRAAAPEQQPQLRGLGARLQRAAAPGLCPAAVLWPGSAAPLGEKPKAGYARPRYRPGRRAGAGCPPLARGVYVWQVSPEDGARGLAPSLP